MTQQTVLTDEQIDQILESPGDLRWALATKTERLVLFARAIEQAVLQSPEMQAMLETAYQRGLREGRREADDHIKGCLA